MPTLKSLVCHVHWAASKSPLQEYGIEYLDGRVECWLPIPTIHGKEDEQQNGSGGTRQEAEAETEPGRFYIHLRSEGYIAPGLAMFVYIDGVYQCNRNRRGLQIPTSPSHLQAGEGHSAQKATNVEFTVRQKEELQANGTIRGKPWRFQRFAQSDCVTDTKITNPSLLAPSAPFDGAYVGMIDVIVLRCGPTDRALASQSIYIDSLPRADSHLGMQTGVPRWLLGGFDGTDEDWTGNARPETPLQMPGAFPSSPTQSQAYGQQARSTRIDHRGNTTSTSTNRRRRQEREMTTQKTSPSEWTQETGGQCQSSGVNKMWNGGHNNGQVHSHNWNNTNASEENQNQVANSGWAPAEPSTEPRNQESNDQQPVGIVVTDNQNHASNEVWQVDQSSAENQNQGNDNLWPTGRDSSDNQTQPQNFWGPSVDQANDVSISNPANSFSENHPQMENTVEWYTGEAAPAMDYQPITSPNPITSHSSTPKANVSGPYWSTWAQVYPEPTLVTRIIPEDPPPKVPPETVAQYHISHQLCTGRPKAYLHRLSRPRYIDTHEEPYAIFRFNYRDTKTVERLLGIEIPEQVVCDQQAEAEERQKQKQREAIEEKKRLAAMSKDELVEELFQARSREPSASVIPASARPDSNVWGADELVDASKRRTGRTGSTTPKAKERHIRTKPDRTIHVSNDSNGKATQSGQSQNVEWGGYAQTDARDTNTKIVEVFETGQTANSQNNASLTQGPAESAAGNDVKATCDDTSGWPETTGGGEEREAGDKTTSPEWGGETDQNDNNNDSHNKGSTWEGGNDENSEHNKDNRNIDNNWEEGPTADAGAEQGTEGVKW